VAVFEWIVDATLGHCGVSVTTPQGSPPQADKNER